MAADSEEIQRLVGKAVTGVLIFLSDWAVVKWGWDLVLQPLFPSLPLLSWYQALILMFVSSVLFKQRTVEIVKGQFSK